LLSAQVPPKTLVYGGNNDFPPYEFLGRNGEPQGFSVGLVRAISRETGIPIEIRLAPWPQTLEALRAGKVDFASLTLTEQRACLIRHRVRTRRTTPRSSNLSFSAIRSVISDLQ
jgi:polar amino acid transport system substrate-binding protein